MVSLAKGQAIRLDKAGGGDLRRAVMGLGWDVVKSRGFLGMGGGGGSIDLDASCLMFDGNRTMVDSIWFRQLQSRDGSIIHTGDNRTGAGSGDDEQIRVDLTRVPPHVQTLVFTVNSFLGQTFDKVENAFCRIVDEETGQEIARYDLRQSGPHTAQVMAKIYRSGSGWEMRAIGEPSNGRTFQDMMGAILHHL
jgi:tellurium resistance protein TerZ